MNYINTYTGKQINSFDLKPEDVCLEDIAHSLSLKVRFGGHLHYNNFYSIAQHSVRVSEYCYKNARRSCRKDIALAGLLHDASEALSVLGDVCKPLKHFISVFAYGRMMNVCEFEDKSAEIIFKALKVERCLDYLFCEDDNIIHFADKVMCQTESMWLRGYPCLDKGIPILKNNGEFDPLISENAYHLFMNRWTLLTNE